MTETTPSKPRASRWLRVALVLSLALNLAVAGIVLGQVAGRSDDRGDTRRAGSDLGLGPYARALPTEANKALRAKLRERRPELREGRRVMGAMFAEALDLLRADELDTKAFMQLLERQRLEVSAQQSLGQAAFVSQIAEMSLEDRRAFADRLEKRVRRGGDKSRGKKRD